MSFSSEMKEELSKINNLSNKELVKFELIGYLISSNASIVKKNKIKFATESEYNINRFAKLLNNVNILDYKIQVQGKSYVITFELSEFEEYACIEENEIFIKNIKLQEEQLKALIRGCFLGAGSMNNPENKYHIEMNFSNIKNRELAKETLENVNIQIKSLNKKRAYSLYMKDGEQISEFLAFIGANKAVLKFEEIRVQREMNNKVNRLVNCEAANLNKVINASVEQINAIEFLKKNHKFEKLNDNLKEIANLRIENPDMPLSELGKLLSNPVGKSGVNYRLKKIIEIAEDEK